MPGRLPNFLRASFSDVAVPNILAPFDARVAMSVIVTPTKRDAQSPLRKDHKRDINFKSSFLRHFLRECAAV